MLKLSLKVLFASAALFSVFSVAPIAYAQGVPAGLLRLDSSVQQQGNVQFTEQERTKLRSAYAHVRKHRAN
jgi:hypothetical protein